MKTFREYLTEISKEAKTRYLGFDPEKGHPDLKYATGAEKEKYNKGAWSRIGKMHQIRREMQKTNSPEYQPLINVLNRKIKNTQVGIERAHKTKR